MHTYVAQGLPYFISSSGVMQFREACYTAVSYAPYILLQIYTITILATFGVTIFEFFHPGPQPNTVMKQRKMLSPHSQLELKKPELCHDGPSRRQASGTDPPIKVCVL